LFRGFFFVSYRRPRKTGGGESFSQALINGVMKRQFSATMGRLGATVTGTDPCSTGGHPKLSPEIRRLQMNKFRFTIKVLAIAIFAFAFATMAQAQATRTWVSGVGDDANPCSRTAPCKTFAGAISKTAVDGEIDALDSGGFGAVTITKSITIDGDSNLAGILTTLGSTGVIVNISAASGSNFVQLRNLSFNGGGSGGNGIRLINGVSGLTVSVENCVIFGFRSGNGRGISDERSQSGELYVQDTLIKNNSGSGAVMIPSGAAVIKATFEHCQFENNGSAGIALEPNVDATANNCTSVENAGAGFFAEGNATANLNLQNCIASHNGQGITANTNAVVRVSNTQVTNNGTGLNNTAGGQISSYGNNNVTANGAGNGPFNGPPISQQ
jgi:hypothetical protein